MEKAGFVEGIAEESCDHLLIGGRLSLNPSEREQVYGSSSQVQIHLPRSCPNTVGIL
jgi:hypothetical protein